MADTSNIANIVANEDPIKNMDLIEYNDIHEQLNKWTILKVLPQTIYRRGMFNFISRLAVKTT